MKKDSLNTYTDVPRNQREPKSTRKSPVASESIATHPELYFPSGMSHMAQDRELVIWPLHWLECKQKFQLCIRRLHEAEPLLLRDVWKKRWKYSCHMTHIDSGISFGLYHLHWRVRYFSKVFALNSLKLRFIFNSSFRFIAKLRGK